MLRIAVAQLDRLGLPKPLVQLLRNIMEQAPQTFYNAGTPEGVVTGEIGDLCINTNGGAGTTLYVKESGNGTKTGWVAK